MTAQWKGCGGWNFLQASDLKVARAHAFERKLKKPFSKANIQRHKELVFWHFVYYR